MLFSAPEHLSRAGNVFRTSGALLDRHIASLFHVIMGRTDDLRLIFLHI